MGSGTMCCSRNPQTVMIMAAEEIRETKNRIAYTVMIVRDFGGKHRVSDTL